MQHIFLSVLFFIEEEGVDQSSHGGFGTLNYSSHKGGIWILIWSIKLVPQRLVLFLHWTHRPQWKLHYRCWISSLWTTSKSSTRLPFREDNQLNK